MPKKSKSCKCNCSKKRDRLSDYQIKADIAQKGFKDCEDRCRSTWL